MSTLRFLTAWTLLLVGCATPRMYWSATQWERDLAFHPVKYPDGDWRPTSFVYHEAWFKSHDGTRLHGWHLPQANPTARVLLLHGNAGNIAQRAEALQTMQRRHRLSLFAFDYRGYGRSDGTPSEQGLYDDARAARAWLAEKEGVAESDIVLLGHELGGAVAAELAATDGARGLILVSTPTSLADVGQRYVPLFPARLLLTMKFDTLANIRRYEGPLLVIHGDQDEVIPYSHGRTLLDAARGRKEMATIPNGRHDTPWNEETRDVIDRFLRELAEPMRGGSS